MEFERIKYCCNPIREDGHKRYKKSLRKVQMWMVDIISGLTDHKICDRCRKKLIQKQGPVAEPTTSNQIEITNLQNSSDESDTSVAPNIALVALNESQEDDWSPIGQSEMGTLACPLCCDNKFSSRLTLKHHLLEIESKIQCPDCCERFHSILELANHLDGQCWKPTEVIEIKNEVLDTKEFSEGDYKSEDGQIAGNIADDSNSCLQEVESVISGLTEESTSQMAIDPLENMDVMIKSEVDSDSEDSLSFKAEMDVENIEECKIDEPSSHQRYKFEPGSGHDI